MFDFHVTHRFINYQLRQIKLKTNGKTKHFFRNEITSNKCYSNKTKRKKQNQFVQGKVLLCISIARACFGKRSGKSKKNEGTERKWDFFFSFNCICIKVLMCADFMMCLSRVYVKLSENKERDKERYNVEKINQKYKNTIQIKHRYIPFGRFVRFIRFLSNHHHRHSIILWFIHFILFYIILYFVLIQFISFYQRQLKS